MSQVIFSKEQSDFIEANGLQITLENGDTYYHLPLFYKKEKECVFELIKRHDLPEEIENIINPYDL